MPFAFVPATISTAISIIAITIFTNTISTAN
jgi:hypothetical protein